MKIGSIQCRNSFPNIKHSVNKAPKIFVIKMAGRQPNCLLLFFSHSVIGTGTVFAELLMLLTNHTSTHFEAEQYFWQKYSYSHRVSIPNFVLFDFRMIFHQNRLPVSE